MTESKLINTQHKIVSKEEFSPVAARILLVLIALLSGPKSYQELYQFIRECGLVNGAYSINTMRTDIATLKAAGCDIGKATKKNDYKYRLKSHPFSIKLDLNDTHFLKYAYDCIIKSATPETLLNYHYVFIKLARMVSDNSIKEVLLGISIFKRMDLSIVEDLVTDEKHNNKIQILYSLKNKEVVYDITLEKVCIRSEKLYAFGYNHTLGKRTFLKLSKIKKIIAKFFDKNSKIGLDAYVKFKLSNVSQYSLEKNETIIETLGDGDDVIIEGRYYNDFIALQRILSFGDDCIVIEPIEMRECVIEKLLEIKELYGS